MQPPPLEIIGAIGVGARVVDVGGAQVAAWAIEARVSWPFELVLGVSHQP